MTRIGVGIASGLALAATVLWAVFLGKLGGFEANTVAPAAVDDARAVAGQLTSLVQWAIIATAIAWFIWQHRAQANLRALGVADTRFTPGWAVGWWLIPFAWYVMPYLTTREVWKASDPEAGATDWLRSSAKLIGWWWAVWLVHWALLISLVSLDADISDVGATVSKLRAEGWLGVVAGLSIALAGFLAIRLVSGVEGRQRAKRERQAGWVQGFSPLAT